MTTEKSGVRMCPLCDNRQRHWHLLDKSEGRVYMHGTYEIAHCSFENTICTGDINGKRYADELPLADKAPVREARFELKNRSGGQL